MSARFFEIVSVDQNILGWEMIYFDISLERCTVVKKKKKKNCKSYYF